MSSLQDSDGNQVWICPACGRVDDGTPMIGCDGCDAWYHWLVSNKIFFLIDENFTICLIKMYCSTGYVLEFKCHRMQMKIGIVECVLQRNRNGKVVTRRRSERRRIKKNINIGLKANISGWPM